MSAFALIDDTGRYGSPSPGDRRCALPNSTTRSFVTDDEPESIRLKATAARKLGGVMFRELSQDTPDGALLESIAVGLGRH